MNHTTGSFWNKQPNCLLLKDDVGKSKPSAYTLPPVQFVYGKPLSRDDEGAKEVTMTWKFHQETRDQEPDRDFKSLNKMSLTQGLHKASQYSQFRKSNDARKKMVKGQNALPIYIPDEEFRYGRANRPSTPMKLVMSNSYGLEYQNRLQEEYKYIQEDMQYKPKLLPRGNKASVLSYEYNKKRLEILSQKGNKEQFKLTKFKFVPPRTQTNLQQRSLKNSQLKSTKNLQNNQQQINEQQFINQSQDCEQIPNQAVE